MFPEIGGIQKEGKFHFEHFRHFPRIWQQGEARRHHPHHRRNVETRAGEIARQEPGDADQCRFDAGLFPRLAQRRLNRREIARLAASARKTDLAAMLAEMLGALGEQQGRFGPGDHLYQHGGGDRLSLAAMEFRKGGEFVAANN